MNHLDINQIKEIIPHRHPFLLVDYIEDYEPGQFAVGYKCVTYREDFFKGHFPQEPVMPWRSDGRGPCTGRCGCNFKQRKKTRERSPISAVSVNVNLKGRLFPEIK